MYARNDYTPPQPPDNWLIALSEIGSSRLRPDIATDEIRTVDALLMALVDGDEAAAMMLRHLLSWFPYSIRKDGAIWRSATQWSVETGLSSSKVYNQTRRARLMRVGIIVFTEKAQGVNQLHFRLDDRTFLNAIAEALGVSRFALRPKLYVRPEQPSPVQDKEQSSLAKGLPALDKIPLTDNTTEKTTEQKTEKQTDNNTDDEKIISMHRGGRLDDLSPGQRELVKLGLFRNAAVDFADIIESNPRQINHLIQTVRNDWTIKSRGGYIRNSLQNMRDNPQDDSTAHTRANPFAGMTWGDFAQTEANHAQL